MTRSRSIKRALRAALANVAELESRLAGERTKAALRASRARAEAKGVPWGHGGARPGEARC